MALSKLQSKCRAQCSVALELRQKPWTQPLTTLCQMISLRGTRQTRTLSLMIGQLRCQEGAFYLGWRDQDVEHPEVLLEAVPHKDAPHVHQVAQLEVGLLQRGQVVWRQVRIQVSWHLQQMWT